MRVNTVALAAAIVGAAHATAAVAEPPRQQSPPGAINDYDLTHEGRDWNLVNVPYSEEQLLERKVGSADDSATVGLFRTSLSRDEMQVQVDSKARLDTRDGAAAGDLKDLPKARPLEVHRGHHEPHLPEHHKPPQVPEHKPHPPEHHHRPCPICGCEELGCCKCPETKKPCPPKKTTVKITRTWTTTTCPGKTTTTPCPEKKTTTICTKIKPVVPTTRCTTGEKKMKTTPAPHQPTHCPHGCPDDHHGGHHGGHHDGHHNKTHPTPPVTVSIGGAAQTVVSGLGFAAAAFVAFLL